MPRSFLRRYRQQVHLVDRSLLLIMVILLIQSTVSLFLSGAPAQTVTTVDVVIRTASAAIFGYLLGGNFGKRKSDTGQAQSVDSSHILEKSAQPESAAPGIQARIGFTADEAPQETQLTAVPPVIRDTESSTGAGIQVLVAAAIGLFCLVALLVLRNLSELGIITELSDSATATVIQFRDFVSGCVGFLIGSPVRASNSNS